jgi:LmbE family N-acetylglucosaminyl deacetylase
MRYDVIVISAHPDDAEAQMDGTLAMLSDKGQRVLLIDLTEGEPTEFAQAGIRAQQANEAARLLGVERLSLGLQDRLLTDTTQTRLQLAHLLRAYRPRWVYSAGEACVHPDHAAVVGLTRAAVFLTLGWDSGSACLVARCWRARSPGWSNASSSPTARWSHPGPILPLPSM